MPVSIKPLGHGRYRVSTPHGVKSYSTSKSKAESQARLLRMIEHENPSSSKVHRLLKLLLASKLQAAVVLVDSMTAHELAQAADSQGVQMALQSAHDLMESSHSRYADKQLQHIDHIRELLSLSPQHSGAPCWSVRIIIKGPDSRKAAKIAKNFVEEFVESRLGNWLQQDTNSEIVKVDLHDCQDHELRNPSTLPPSVDHLDAVIDIINKTCSDPPTAHEVNKCIVAYAAEHGIDPLMQADMRRTILHQVYQIKNPSNNLQIARKELIDSYVSFVRDTGEMPDEVEFQSVASKMGFDSSDIRSIWHEITRQVRKF